MRLFLVFSLSVLAGCAGQLYTVKNPKFEGSRIKGVIVYQPKPLVLVYETTQLVDDKGNVAGLAPQACTPVQSYEITSVTDYAEQYALVYEPGLFESNKFSVELDKGVVKGVNMEATSAAKETLQVLQEVLQTAKELKTFTPSVVQPPVKPQCNAGKKILGRKDINDIPKL